MDILQLYQDYSVNFLTEGHKHCREGWVNTPCPFCTGNPGYHLSYNLEDNFFLCWRCGWHPIIPTISTLINVTEKEAKKIIRQYGLLLSLPKKEIVTVTKIEHRLPSGTIPLGKNHRAYLEKRGYDPDKLERTWKLVGTGPISLLDGIDYKHRIVIPFIWDNKQVSFDSRDITDKHMARYMACPKNRELIPHKEIVYGKQEFWIGSGICVEGPTDVWRLGPFSFAVSGIKYTQKQLQVIAKNFKRVFVMFDNDPQAVIQSDKLVAELRFRGVETYGIQLEKDQDPGSMKQEDANYLVKQLINDKETKGIC